jgi:hypothetical protein
LALEGKSYHQKQKVAFFSRRHVPLSLKTKEELIDAFHQKLKKSGYDKEELLLLNAFDRYFDSKSSLREQLTKMIKEKRDQEVKSIAIG